MKSRKWILTACVAVPAYAYAGYPVLIRCIGALRARPVHKAAICPPLSIIIAAHNEAAALPRKLDSLFEQYYPLENLEVIIASDGSTDGTGRVADAYAQRGIQMVTLDLERGGKARALNRAVAEARHDILVFSDANAMLGEGSLRALVASFADSNVGGVSANEMRVPDSVKSAAGMGERLYWEYDKWLKQAETRAGSMVSASGSMYAIRRSLFRPIVDLAATDDFTISTQVVRAGYRLVFEPDSITWEPSVTSGEAEFGRKMRVTTRGLRSVWGARDLLSPRRTGLYALQLFSHKVLRRGVGFCGAGAYVVTATLVRQRGYRALFAVQTLFYGLACVGWLAQDRGWGRKRWLYIPYYVCMSNLAAMLGVVRVVRGTQVEQWEPKRND